MTECTKMLVLCTKTENNVTKINNFSFLFMIVTICTANKLLIYMYCKTNEYISMKYVSKHCWELKA